MKIGEFCFFLKHYIIAKKILQLFYFRNCNFFVLKTKNAFLTKATRRYPQPKRHSRVQQGFYPFYFKIAALHCFMLMISIWIGTWRKNIFSKAKNGVFTSIRSSVLLLFKANEVLAEETIIFFHCYRWKRSPISLLLFSNKITPIPLLYFKTS